MTKLAGEGGRPAPAPRGAVCWLAAAVLLVLLAAWEAPAVAAVGQWTSIGPDGGRVNVFAVDPLDRSVVYAATESSGVFKSADGGATWAAVNEGLPDGGIVALAIDPTRPSTLYASLDYPGLFVSGDGGALWRPASVRPSLGEMGLACDPNRPDTVFIVNGQEIWVSGDRGGRWNVSRRFHEALSIQIAADPAHSLLLALVEGPGGLRLHGSADHGATWKILSAALPEPINPEKWQLAVDPEPPGSLYLAYTASGQYGWPGSVVSTYQSNDAGGSWHPSGPGGFPIAVGPGHVVYAGSYRSADLGRSWTPIAAPAFMVQALAVGASPDAVYAADGTVGGVRRSTDGGRSWQASSRGLRASSAVALAVDPSNPARLYAYEANEGFFASGDHGGHWRGATCIPWACSPDLRALTLAVDPVDGANVYVASPQGLYMSTDRGNILAAVHPGLTGCLYIGSLVIAPTSPATLYAAGGLYSSCAFNATPQCSLFKSLDGGEIWDCLGVDAVSIALAPSSPSTLYAVGYPGANGTPLLRTTDQGGTWEVVNAAVPMEFPNFPYAPFLMVDPAEPRRLYAVDFWGGLWRSVNGGRTWRQIYQQGSIGPLLVAIDPVAPGVLYVASSQAGVVVRSADFGRTWQPLLAGLPQGYFFSHYLQLLADPRRSGTIYLATDNHGILTYTVPER
jgi:photosystem II stability/assembly factor-like uncharacterized protein